MDKKSLENIAAKLRLDTLIAINKAGSGHAGSCMSCMDILVALYYGAVNGVSHSRNGLNDGAKNASRPCVVMKFNPNKSRWDERDYFVLSKGHAVPALYAVLAEQGFFDKSEMKYLRQIGGLLQGYPNVKVPGIEASVGSVGQGVSIAVGLAMAIKADRENRNVFVLAGDGELQEGQCWEAIMAAAHFKLDNLVLIIDQNKLQLDGACGAVMNVAPLADKFEAFGWKVIPVVSGHDIEELVYAFEKAKNVARQPVVILAPTIEGKGVPFAENKPAYHGVPFSDAEMEEVMKKFGEVEEVGEVT